MAYVKDINRLKDIKWAIKELANEALDICRKDDMIYARSKSYWYPHIVMELDKDHSYLGGTMYSLEDAISAFENLYSEDDEEDEEDG